MYDEFNWEMDGCLTPTRATVLMWFLSAIVVVIWRFGLDWT